MTPDPVDPVDRVDRVDPGMSSKNADVAVETDVFEKCLPQDVLKTKMLL